MRGLFSIFSGVTNMFVSKKGRLHITAVKEAHREALSRQLSGIHRMPAEHYKNMSSNERKAREPSREQLRNRYDDSSSYMNACIISSMNDCGSSSSSSYDSSSDGGSYSGGGASGDW